MSEVINDAYETLALKFIEAGHGDGDGIDENDLATVGIDKKEFEQLCEEKPRLYTDDWWDFTRWVYKKLTGEDMQPSGLRGTGFRSKYHGNQVAKALRGKNPI